MSKSRMDIYRKPDPMLTLYRVIIKSNQTYYVVSQNPTEAYMLVKKFLDDNDLLFSNDRELRKIEPIASNYYSDGYDMLMVKEVEDESEG